MQTALYMVAIDPFSLYVKLIIYSAMLLVAIAGGGTGTESTLPSFGLLLRHPSLGETEAAARLRSRELPVLVRISEGRLVVDLRSVTPEEDDEILQALGDTGTRP